MNVCSVWFLISVGLAAIFYQLLPTASLRRFFLSAINVAFLIPLVPNWESWAGYAVFILLSFVFLRLIKLRPSGILLTALLSLTISAFLMVKRYSFLEWIVPTSIWEHAIELIGISYMLFKFIHMLVDEWQGQLDTYDLLSYANYQLAFFTLLAGPIQRYNEFHAAWQEMDAQPVETRDTLLAWNRILTGLIKAVLATIVGEVFDKAGSAPTNLLIPRLLVNFYGFPLYVYLNFSGYTDVMIGSGSLFGFKLPENFNYPFLGRNVIDFWNRWHITLTHWVRDYVFMTSYKAVAERFPLAAKYVGYVLLGVALFIAGLWHGATGGFAIFGVLQGAGAAVNQAWQDLLKGWMGRAGFHNYQKNRLIQLAAILLTLHFFCFSMLFFSGRIDREIEILDLLNRNYRWTPELGYLVHSSYFKVALTIMAVASLGWWWKSAVIALNEHLQARLLETTRRVYTVVTLKTVFVLSLYFLQWTFVQKDPVIVYMRF